MSKSKSRQTRPAAYSSSLILIACLLIAVTGFAGPSGKFERTYNPQGSAHLTITNVNGRIRVAAWDKKTVSVRADAAPSVSIEDRVVGEDINISVKRNFRLSRADFEVSLPADSSLVLRNVIGNIEVQGVNGHISVNSIDSDVRLLRVNSSAVDVKVTSGDIYFDGELREGGSYSFQSMRGDLDVTLPGSTPFNLNARALSENINLGGFLSSLTRGSRGTKGVSGSYLNGGSRLTLTTYEGRILLHKK
jgi:Putative adhesin